MEFGRDFDQPIGEAFELSPNVLVSELAAIHLDQVAGLS
jgi:hypothetical protein